MRDRGLRRSKKRDEQYEKAYVVAWKGAEWLVRQDKYLNEQGLAVSSRSKRVEIPLDYDQD